MLFNNQKTVLKKLSKGLDLLVSNTQIRKENAALYFNGIINPLFTLHKMEVGFWRFPILFNGSRKQLLEENKKSNIKLTAHYRSLARTGTNIVAPNADFIDDHIINVFVKPETPRKTITDTIIFLNSYRHV